MRLRRRRKSPLPFILNVTSYIIIIIIAHETAFARTTITPPPPLDEALLDDILPPRSDLCTNNPTTTTSSSQSSSSTYTLSYHPSSSQWTPPNLAYEPSLFLAELNHTSPNPNRTWSLRIGRGGFIYSFVGPFGEAVPPQHMPYLAPWIDEVWQMVAVDQVKNRDEEDGSFFVHQSGPYMKDSNFTPPPFYTPTLAHYCTTDTNNGLAECSILSWGQLSNQPTTYRSHVLYATRYRDCGEGVIEYATAIHNMDDDDDDDVRNERRRPPDAMTFLNVPWGGVRTSHLKSLILSSADDDDDDDDESLFPIVGFGHGSPWPQQRRTKGYTLFAESLPLKATFPAPCATRETRGCRYWGWVQNMTHSPRLIVAANNTSGEYRNRWSERRGLECVSLRMEEMGGEMVGGCPACMLMFTNERSGWRMVVTDVLHWSTAGPKGGELVAFCPMKGISIDDINNQFWEGDEILVDYADKGKPIEENRGLAFVHGVDEEVGEEDNRWIILPSIVQYGATYATHRDYTVYCSTSWIDIRPGDTYQRRSYIITGEYQGLAERSRRWVDETLQDFYYAGDYHASENDDDGSRRRRRVRLVSFDNHKRVGASIIIHDNKNNNTDKTTLCNDGGGVMVCEGHVTPDIGKKPLFAISCGNDDNDAVISSNPYHLSLKETYYNRAYACDGKGRDVRPTWKLLGYFAEGDCEAVEKAIYDPALCLPPPPPPPAAEDNDGNNIFRDDST